ncbi:hypothetical protein D3C76_1622580 [compost metagenome]
MPSGFVIEPEAKSRIVKPCIEMSSGFATPFRAFQHSQATICPAVAAKTVSHYAKSARQHDAACSVMVLVIA